MNLALESLNKLDRFLSQFPLLLEFEKKTKLPKAYAVTALGFFYSMLILLNVWGELLSNIVGFAYPCYASFQAIESTDKRDDTHWLTYWTVFGFINMAEFFTDTILYWMPFYFTLKTILVLYLYLPQFQGANVLYSKFIRPYLVQNESMVDDAISSAKAKLSEINNLAKAKIDSNFSKTD